MINSPIVEVADLSRVWVELDSRSYPIYIHKDWNILFQEAFDYLDRKKGSLKGKKIMVITDRNVHSLYHNTVVKYFREVGMEAITAVVEPGESSKSLTEAEKLYTAALKANLERSSFIAALGGGVIGDLAGFVASTYMRGIPFIQIPTSLLAQVDSSVGGKVAVNHSLAKNIIGAFYQPECVLMNTAVLAALPDREMATGMAELIKHGIIRDEAFLSWLASNKGALAARDPDMLARAVHRSCEIKTDVVVRDEREQGLRAILNFGHTIGHAIEAAAGYGIYTHGEAVSMGMVAEAHIARLLGLISAGYVERISGLLADAGLPTTLPELDAGLLLEWMKHDKKNVSGQIVFVLPTAPGRVEVFRNVKEEVILKALEAALVRG